MSGIKIINEDKNKIEIMWEKEGIENEYEILGLNRLFIYEKIASTTKNTISLKKKNLKKYMRLKVNYVVLEKDIAKKVIIGTSKELIINEQKLEDITVKCIKSYEGLTLTFASKSIFDKYFLYEKVDNEYNLLMILEDPIVNSKIVEENKIYYVEAYNKEYEEYVMKAKSDDYICKIHNIPKVSKKPKISVAIPVYNSEGFINKCVDSVLGSTMEDIEIILVDDESKDNSPKIIDWYSNYYKGIVRSYHQKNIGVSGTRNRGIELSNGEFIALLDNDDIVHPRMYEELYNSAISLNTDIAIGKTLIREGVEDHSMCLDVPNPNNEEFTAYTYEEMLYYKNKRDYKNIYFVAVWNKIIKADIVKAHLFPPLNHYEDSAYTKMIYSYIDRFAFSHNAYYIWDKRRRKTTGTATTYNYKNETQDEYLYHKKYCDGVFYAYKDGNKDKMDFVIFDIIKESYDYLKEYDSLDEENKLFEIYKDAIKELNSKYRILEVGLIKVDRELTGFVKKMLK